MKKTLVFLAVVALAVPAMALDLQFEKYDRESVLGNVPLTLDPTGTTYSVHHLLGTAGPCLWQTSSPHSDSVTFDGVAEALDPHGTGENGDPNFAADPYANETRIDYGEQPPGSGNFFSELVIDTYSQNGYDLYPAGYGYYPDPNFAGDPNYFVPADSTCYFIGITDPLDPGVQNEILSATIDFLIDGNSVFADPNVGGPAPISLPLWLFVDDPNVSLVWDGFTGIGFGGIPTGLGINQVKFTALMTPEPGALSLLALGAMTLLRRR